MDKIICNRKLKNKEGYIKGAMIREPIFELIKKEYPVFTKNCYIRQNEIEKFRKIHLENLIKQERGNFDILDKEVIQAISNKDVISDNIESDLEKNLSFGQRIADKVAVFGGSWTFIFIFGLFLILWMIINVWLMAKRPFDPYPFILLNLILSTLAAIQAPIIMMSQNRQEDKDRKRGESDYKINLKAELEVKLLHEKVDYLILSQNKRLLEMQEIQTDYLEEIIEKINGKSA
jgi:uncharacterized membrane protein